MKKSVMIFLILVFAVTLLYGGEAHPVIIELIAYEGGDNYPDEEDVTFSAYITTRPGEVLTESSQDCYYPYLINGDEENGKFIHIQVGNFTTNWEIGDQLYVEASDGTHSNNDIIELNGDNYQILYGTGLFDGAPLPVTLSSFTAAMLDDIPVLQWITASEQNNQGWNIYRNETDSQDNSMQINTEIIMGQGTTSESFHYVFQDEYDIIKGNTYYYWLESISLSGMVETYGPVSLYVPDSEEENPPEVPLTYGLYQNYPNPFNPITKINFALQEGGNIELSIYNIKGQKIKEIYNGSAEKEMIHSYIWDGTDHNGFEVGSGIYMYQLKTSSQTYTRKLNLIK